MPKIAISPAGQLGLITDVKPYELPPTAWSMVSNMHFLDGKVKRMLGHKDLFGTKSGAPYFVGFARSLAGVSFWVYANGTDVWAYDTAHTEITRVSGDYSAAGIRKWQGGVINGLFLMTNDTDQPQVWSPVAAAQKLVDLPNWPANTRCRVMKAFKNHLIALDVDKNGTRDPRMIKWSHPAASGAVPTSWDETDATKDAGEFSLADTEGRVVDSVTLREENVLYKDDSIYRMRYIGGNDIFDFKPMFQNIGALSKNCAVEYVFGKHLVFGKDDIFLHDGNQMQSVIHQKIRRNLYNSLDTTEALNSYVITNPLNHEIWICYAEQGQPFPNVALVWNWDTGATGKREIPLVPSMVRGIVDEEAGEDLWSSNAQTWDGDALVWGETVSNPSLTRIVMAEPTNTKLMGVTPDAGDHDGTVFTAEVERTGLGIPFAEASPPDISTVKFCRGVWPRISGTIGQSVEVRMGYQMEIEGAITWLPWKTFVIGTDEKVDFLLSGRLFAIAFRSTTTFDWELSGYSLDVDPIGGF